MEHKSGYKTTEFYLVVLSNAIFIAGALAGYIDKELSAKLVEILTVVYVTLRTISKSKLGG